VHAFEQTGIYFSMFAHCAYRKNYKINMKNKIGVDLDIDLDEYYVQTN